MYGTPLLYVVDVHCRCLSHGFHLCVCCCCVSLTYWVGSCFSHYPRLCCRVSASKVFVSCILAFPGVSVAFFPSWFCLFFRWRVCDSTDVAVVSPSSLMMVRMTYVAIVRVGSFLRCRVCRRGFSRVCVAESFSRKVTVFLMWVAILDHRAGVPMMLVLCFSVGWAFIVVGDWSRLSFPHFLCSSRIVSFRCCRPFLFLFFLTVCVFCFLCCFLSLVSVVACGFSGVLLLCFFWSPRCSVFR